MVDTLTRLAGPTQPAKTEAGTTIYNPSTGLIVVRNAILTNTHPSMTGWVWLSLGALTSRANRLASAVPVPPGGVVKLPLDLVMDGTVDEIRARQVMDMTNSNLVFGVAVAGVSSSPDSTTFVTSSWTSAVNEVYVMSVLSTHASAAEIPSSFTDTHAGFTWTLIQSVQSTDGTQRLSQWRAQSSGSTSTTTTVTFSTTMTGCVIQIVKILGADTSGTHGDAAITPAGTMGAPLGLPALRVPSLGADEQCGARLGSLTSAAADTWAGYGNNILLFTGSYTTPNTSMGTVYSKSAGPDISAFISSGNGTAPRLGGIVNVQDSTKSVNVTLNGVVS